MILATVLSLSILDDNYAVVDLTEDLHTVFIGFGIIDGPSDGGVGFTCDSSRYTKGLASSDDYTILDGQIQFYEWDFCGGNQYQSEKKRIIK